MLVVVDDSPNGFRNLTTHTRCMPSPVRRRIPRVALGSRGHQRSREPLIDEFRMSRPWITRESLVEGA